MTIWLTLLTLGSAMAVVEEPTEERSSNNCHCEQVQHGGIHGASPASMCDKGCPGGTFCSQFHCSGTRARPSIHGCAWLCAPPPPPPRRVAMPIHGAQNHGMGPSFGFGGAHMGAQQECFLGYTRTGAPCTSPPFHQQFGSVWSYLAGEPSAAEASPKAAVMSAIGGLVVVGMVALVLVVGVSKLVAKRSGSAVRTVEPAPTLL